MLTVITEENENAIIASAKQGDCDAFELLVMRYRVRLTDLIYRMYGDEILAEDAAQTAFIQAWRHLPGFDAKGTFRSWLFKIGLNAALDHLRRDKRPLVDIDAVVEMSQDRKLEDAIVEQERWSNVQLAVAELPDASRSVLVLKEYQGLRYQEIADVLDIPLGTVMSRLNYARKILAGKLSEYMEDL